MRYRNLYNEYKMCTEDKTSLYLWGYSERVPISFHMTFPTKYNSQSLKKENVIITRVKDGNY